MQKATFVVVFALLALVEFSKCATVAQQKGQMRSCGTAGEVLCEWENPCVVPFARAGAKWACVPFAVGSICADKRFSCVEGYTCNMNTMTCDAEIDGASVPMVENLHGIASTAKRVRNRLSVCSIIIHELPSHCTCSDETLGARVQCSVTLPDNLDTVSATIEVSPCKVPAHVSVSVSETRFRKSHTLAALQAGTNIDEPIPGVDFDIPKIGNAGLDLVIRIDGDLDDFEISLGLDVCAKLLDHKVCMSKFTSTFPVMLIGGRFHFSNVCEEYGR